MGNHAVNESALNARIMIPMSIIYDNETERLMSGENVAARVGHSREDSVIRVEANRIVKNAKGQIIDRPTISRSKEKEIGD